VRLLDGLLNLTPMGATLVVARRATSLDWAGGHKARPYEDGHIGLAGAAH
jgi:hypothetical protein